MKENLIDLFQVMKFAGTEIDQIFSNPFVSYEDNMRYFDLRKLWFNAASQYAAKKTLQNQFSMN